MDPNSSTEAPSKTELTPPETWSLLDLASFLRRNAVVILGSAFAIGLLAAVGLYYYVSPVWEASAILVVVPPKFSSQLKPATLTIQGYQQLLESDAVVAEAKKRLIKKKFLKKTDPFRVGREIRTRIFVSRRAEETTLAPMVQAVAFGKTPEQAAAMADTWAEVFLERVRSVMGGTTSQTVQFIEEQYPLAKSALLKKEQERVQTLENILKRMNSVAISWDRKISQYKNKTTELVNAYSAETDRMVEEYRSRKALSTRNIRFQALQKRYSDLLDEQNSVTARLQKREIELKAARQELDKVPLLFTLKKTITDDALWKVAAGHKAKEPDWQSLQDQTLLSQKINPVYVELLSRIADLSVEAASLRPLFTHLDQQLNEIRKEITAMEVPLRQDEAGLEKIKLERGAGLAVLQEQRKHGLETIQRQRDVELKSLQLELESARKRLDREVSIQRDLFKDLARHYNQAILAKAQRDVEDIRLASPAVPPDVPVSQRIPLKILLAVLAGGILGVFIALIREAGRFRT